MVLCTLQFAPLALVPDHSAKIMVTLDPVLHVGRGAFEANNHHEG